jgi:hypothetical protein
MTNPDTQTRLLVAAILLIVVLAYANAGAGIWDYAREPFP